MKSTIRQSLVALLFLGSWMAPCHAQTVDLEVPENWKCKWCAFEEGFKAELSFGPGWVSESSFRFGKYSGLEDEGFHAVIGGEVAFSGQGVKYFDLKAIDLGLSSRSFVLSGGAQGSYDFDFTYKETPNFLLDTGSTPFVLDHPTTLVLPVDWAPSYQTDLMTSLERSLHGLDVETQRKTLMIGGLFHAPKNRDLYLRVRRDVKHGRKATGASFGTDNAFAATSSIIPEPINYVTTQIEAGVSMYRKRWQGEAGYYGSFFDNQHATLSWQNPFAQASSVLGHGQLGLPPDNTFHQTFVSGLVQLSDHTRGTVYAALGRMTQNDNFVQSSINPLFSSLLLPRSSLDAQVDTRTARLMVVSNLSKRLELKASYLFDERDNDTGRAAYQYIVADTSQSIVTRMNSPLSLRRSSVKLDARLRLPRNLRLSAGAEQKNDHRSYQVRSKTDEARYWGEMAFRPHPRIDARLKYTYSERSGNPYQAVESVSPPDNPLLRKFHLADRERQQLGASLSLWASDAVTVSLGLDHTSDHYTDSVLGLTKSEDTSYSLDFSVFPGQNFQAYAYYSEDFMATDQAGSQTLGAPDWWVDAEDRIQTVGVNLEYRPSSKLELKLGYTFSEGISKTRPSSDTLDLEALPDLRSKLRRLTASARFELKGPLSMVIRYLYQEYDNDDFAVDGVSPDTVWTVLGFGEGSPGHKVSVVHALLEYRFGP